MATGQHGVVTREQLLAIGFRPGGIKGRLEAGRLHKVHRSVYAVGHPRLDRCGRWLAAVLACGEGAVLSHRSAAVLWGLTRLEGTGVDVTAKRGRAGRQGVLFHECKLEPEDVTLRGAIPVTTATRTLFDIAEWVDWRVLKRACEEADRLDLLQMKELERIIERGWGRHALKSIRPIVSESRRGEPTRSTLEDRFVAFCHDHDLPPPATNVVVLDFEVDALWPAQRLIAELDGFAFHRHRAAFERDRARDAALIVAGYRVIRITFRRLANEPNTVASEVRELLGRS